VGSQGNAFLNCFFDRNIVLLCFEKMSNGIKEQERADNYIV
jgi:hypothetical protein